MKQIAILLMMFISIKSFAQNNKDHTLYLKDGTTLVAKSVSFLTKKYAKIVTKKGEKIKIPYHKIYRHLFYQRKTSFSPKNIPNLTEFVAISNDKGDMMPILIEGHCNLYTGYIPQLRNSGAYGFYVKRKGENIATCIGSTNWHETRNLKENALKYFKDCPVLIARIKEEFKRNKIVELVEFYNKKCL